ncbi:MAG: hypothetical protein WCF06_15330 [Nitrososphaeraceae archaeon]
MYIRFVKLGPSSPTPNKTYNNCAEWKLIMRTKTTLLAIFVIVTAIALVTAGSITASTLAVKKKSTTTTKKSTGSKKTKSSKTSTGGSATTTTAAAGIGNSTLGGTDKISKFSICMRLVSGPLTRANLDQCYNIVYGTSSTSSVIGSLPNAGPTSRAVPKTSNIGPSSSSSSTTLGTP